MSRLEEVWIRDAMNTLLSWIWIACSSRRLVSSCKSCLEPTGPPLFLGKRQKQPLLQLSSTHFAAHVIIQKFRIFIKEGFDNAVNTLLGYLFGACQLNSGLIRTLVTNATFSLRMMIGLRHRWCFLCRCRSTADQRSSPLLSMMKMLSLLQRRRWHLDKQRSTTLSNRFLLSMLLPEPGFVKKHIDFAYLIPAWNWLKSRLKSCLWIKTAVVGFTVVLVTAAFAAATVTHCFSYQMAIWVRA